MKENNNVCDSCCSMAGEMGFIIGKGDETVELNIQSNSKEDTDNKLKEYLSVAQKVNPDYTIETQYSENDKNLYARIKFDVTAEKIIFELNTRSLNK